MTGEKFTYKITGLDCAEEVAILKQVVGKADGVIDLAFNILQAKMVVTYDPTVIDSRKISSLVASTGMKATPWEEARHEPELPFWQRHLRLFFTVISGLFLMAAIILHLEEGLLPLTRSFYAGAILFGVWFVLPKAFFSLTRLRPDMNLLMVIAIIGALAIGEWFEGATVAFLFSLSLLLEQWSVGRARRAISSLMDLSPTLARVIDPKTGHIEEKAVEEVALGSLVLIRPGEKIPLDGVVVKGDSSVDQSPITGESIPVPKEVGDELFAGTLNEEGALECKVTKIAQDTTLSRIIHLVEEARSKRSTSEQWVESFAKYYTPIMLLLALLMMTVPPLIFALPWFDWIYRGLVLLVIACPCALVISTPVSIVSGLTTAARQGVLVKGGVYLEMVGHIRAIALDKTGTLTFGHPEVQEIVPLNGHTSEELLERAVALERPSEHPLARAILRKGVEEKIKTEKVDSFQIFKGKGAQATYRGKSYWIGSHRYMHEMGQETDEVHDRALELEDAGHSIVAIGNQTHVCGLISVADSPRPFIAETIAAIKGAGIQEIVMLTGDNEPTAAALAKLSGVDTFYAELLPEDKVDAVLALRKKWKKVAMVGDGVNDAPAMAAANLGIAMGGMGTDAAIETADVALMSDDLSKIPWLIRHSHKVLKIIKQNITFSLGLKALFIGLTFFNLVTLWMAIAADTGATLLVIFNALRLLRSAK